MEQNMREFAHVSHDKTAVHVLLSFYSCSLLVKLKRTTSVLHQERGSPEGGVRGPTPDPDPVPEPPDIF